ncbi:hypothetical protein DAPPUDRAFT_320018 [Daphnia pulex]|uniref:Transposase Helix-turn-helix domain-containing protein n=1 Tax=Daphnia pulex TaxID=6669 RepID=E9GNL1_DAPPU|nr:hypothetical protein DAPPUDRAFT_320018 [Daphnia pulex]|eukprot:EFX78789.1 hypothetical protein DAPPUDRAFT_320018 [Daphnia pulex]
MAEEFEGMDNSSEMVSQLKILEAENKNLKLENERVNKELKSAFVMISELPVEHHTASLKLYEAVEGKPKKSFLSKLEKSEQMTLFYTGLNSFELFIGIFNALLLALVDDNRFKISLQEQFLMTLMKLRLNLSLTDLGYRFEVSRFTACKDIEKFITEMFVRLPPVILRYPDKEASEYTMPLSFMANYPKCTCIIDCFETNCEMHGFLLAKISLFSKYESHHTSKFLIAITPQGSICFISKGYGGELVTSK